MPSTIPGTIAASDSQAPSSNTGITTWNTVAPSALRRATSWILSSIASNEMVPVRISTTSRSRIHTK